MDHTEPTVNRHRAQRLDHPMTGRPFWITLKGGVVTAIEQQFVP